MIARLARRRASVVTAGTAAGDSIVIEGCRDPRNCPVAVFAQVRCLDVGRRLASGRGAVVAAHTSAGDGAVVDPGIGECRGGMTIVT